MTTPLPFNIDYTATNFTGFSISVDLVSGDQTLGANWQALQMGQTSLSAMDAPAGGYQLSRFQLIGELAYGPVTLTRPWTPDQSGWIPEWFALAEQYGGTAVGITIHYLDNVGEAQNVTYNFRNAYPVTWNQPTFRAFERGETPPAITESLTFSHSGYFATDGLATGIDTAEAVQPCKLVILPGAAASSGVASALSSLTSWTGVGAEFGMAGGTTVSSTVSSMLGPFPAVQFWVPPASINVSKAGGWSVDSSPTAQGSGPATWTGTNPMSMSFDFILDGSNSDSNVIQNEATSGRNLGTGPSGASIMPQADQLLSLLEMDPVSALIGTGTAPLVILVWGDFVSPVSYVESVSLQFTRFNASGEPIRAQGSLSITQYPVATALQNPTSGGELARQAATVYDGDTLAHVAYRQFRQPNRWRDIAEQNGIDDPMRVPAGTQVLVPSVDELPQRGESGVAQGTRADAARKLQRPLNAGGGA